jgi:predicted CoA-substrate-specific enzyme activase
MERSLGICLGASSIQVVELLADAGCLRVGRTIVRSHESDPRRAFLDVLETIDGQGHAYGLVTGRKFRAAVNVPSITEPEAVENALAFLSQVEGEANCSAVVSLGAESFVSYTIDSGGHVSSVETGNKCASGTGEFFLQQIGRMGLSLADAVRQADGAEPYRVSGRCSVFCKSDCTHALNKGTPIGRVTAGLCSMMADKVVELSEKNRHGRVLAVGGVTNNPVIVGLLRERIPSLDVPQHAETFEALGAAFYALERKIGWKCDKSSLFRRTKPLFDRLPPIRTGAPLVRFEERRPAIVVDGDECIVGLDVGSTTTKAVALRIRDDAVLASVYLRTTGDPVRASRECYRELAARLGDSAKIIAIGTTGSGRQIAGLHAGTDAIINEIIAHAAGAAYYDPLVDTVFEIGGQDAKYCHLTNGVPSDYAMNEACSAGTGSFLEEAAREALAIDYRDIQDLALGADSPPNFNDQCAAFISSDVKVAVHEGVARDDITAGLVYSICMNYMNRVKGQRAVGERVFMQGGVCYNRAVPMAMAVLLGKEIVVPPDPGLVGAFGLALEIKDRLVKGLLEPGLFNLQELAEREVGQGRSFVCGGGSEKCDRKCEIASMTIAGRKYAFGGACNRYYNIIHHVDCDPAQHENVKLRQRLVFEEYAAPLPDAASGTPLVGINRSFLIHTLYPLYSHFFAGIGCRIVLSPGVDDGGIKRKGSSLCYPFEIAHGAFASLLGQRPDVLFMPRVIEMPVDGCPLVQKEHQCTCQLLQGEAYCLKSAFKGEVGSLPLMSPDLNFAPGYLAELETFVGVARRLGVERARAAEAYKSAAARQEAFDRRLKEEGRRLLAELERSPERIAVVLFGRAYNAFADEANLGIPAKFASRGITVIPWDLIPGAGEPWDDTMMWATGQGILRVARVVKGHPQLFAAFITNFSCGPDSFVIGYFRDAMGIKPALTLELDSHSADAGINTRIEAFVDVVSRFRKLGVAEAPRLPFRPAEVRLCGGSHAVFTTSDARTVDMRDPSVKLLIPSMGRLSSELMAAAFRGSGYWAETIPVYDFEALRLGRGNTSCKECLPLTLVTGGLLKYLQHRARPNEKLAYFMPTSSGSCRFSQYHVFLKRYIEKHRLPDLAIFSLTADNGYMGLAPRELFLILRAAVAADVLEDIRSALYVLAHDRESALAIFEEQWLQVLEAFTRRRAVRGTLRSAAVALSRIPLRFPLARARIVEILGEIFVRRDEFSLQDLVERFAERDIIAKKAPIFEWIEYCDYPVAKGLLDGRLTAAGRLQFRSKGLMQRIVDRGTRRILARSGLCAYDPVDVKDIIAHGSEVFDPCFMGEPILVAGAVLRNVPHHAHGAVSIGPFGCMPGRIIEAVVSREANDRKIPFLAIESDGNAFPQVLEARIEAFCLQVERLHANHLGPETVRE